MATKIGDNNANVLDGTIFADLLKGLGGNDILNGNAGTDTLIGGTGSDSVFGGRGRDFLVVGDGDTAANEIYDGGGTSDTDTLLISESAATVVGNFEVDFSQSTLLDIDVVQFQSSVNVKATFAGSSFSVGGIAHTATFAGSTAADSVVINMLGDTQINLSGLLFSNWGLSDKISIFGTDAAETITGTSQRDIVTAGGGINSVSTGAGDDIVIFDRTSVRGTYNAGSGVDQLNITAADINLGFDALLGFKMLGFEVLNLTGPGNHNVTLNADQFGTGLSLSGTINAETGSANSVTVQVNGTDNNFSASSLFFGGFDADDRFIIAGDADANSLTGSKINDVLQGNGGNDVLLGGQGNDTLDGGIGADVMFGGSGNDIYVVDDAGDIAAEILIGVDPGGKDTVRASVTHTLTGFIETLVLTGSGTIDGTGNALSNVINGSNGSNVIRGLGGADRIAGRGGSDKLFGGSGADQFIYTALADSRPGSGSDAIRDFLPGIDHIRVSAIDANGTVAGNQAFVEDTNGSLAAGEFRFREVNGNTLVEFETDGTAGIDMRIVVVGVTGLDAGDLIL